MLEARQVVVPALSLRTNDGAVDFDATDRYAKRAAGTWIGTFLLSGSTTLGNSDSPAVRGKILDLWRDRLPSDRLMTCCWCAEDFAIAGQKKVRPMGVLQGCESGDDVLAYVADLPPGAFVYSHPMLSASTIDSSALAAVPIDRRPSGGKFAKVAAADLRALRAASGPAFELWDGSSRNIAASLGAMASGVVATPLCIFPDPFPPLDLIKVQAAVVRVQEVLDTLPTPLERTNFLSAAANAVNCPS